MAKRADARPRPAAAIHGRPPRASVPAFGGWAGAAAAAAAPDYSLDFTNIRAARMHRRTKALSWSSFVGNAAVVETSPGSGGEEEKRQWSPAAAYSDDDDNERRRHSHGLRRLRSADIDDRQPIQPRRAAPKVSSRLTTAPPF